MNNMKNEKQISALPQRSYREYPVSWLMIELLVIWSAKFKYHFHYAMQC